jgi:hypothetical protein
MVGERTVNCSMVYLTYLADIDRKHGDLRDIVPYLGTGRHGPLRPGLGRCFQGHAVRTRRKREVGEKRHGHNRTTEEYGI